VPLAPRSAVVAAAERAWRGVEGRVHRKALPRQMRQPGDPWSNEDWKSFKGWALDHGAKYDKKEQELAWVDDRGRRHRTDGPASIKKDGREEWYLNGRRHRPDGPALIRPGGHEAWYLNGHRHRENGPAVVWPNGHEEWWLNGRIHRPDGPARVYSDGTQSWWLNGQRHRENGPAVVYSHGVKEWWLNGVQFTDGTFTTPVVGIPEAPPDAPVAPDTWAGWGRGMAAGVGRFVRARFAPED
jgi:hypothetical protein